MAVTRMATGTAGLGANVLTDVYLEKTFVSSLLKKLLLYRLGEQSGLPEGIGKTVRWQFFSVPAANTTALATEGADPPNSTDFTTTTAQTALSEYAGFTDFSKFLARTALNGTIEKMVELLGYQKALTLDTLCHSTVNASTVTVNAGTAMTADALRQAASKLGDSDVLFHKATGGRYYCGIFRNEGAYDMVGEGAPAWFQAKSSLISAALENSVGRNVDEGQTPSQSVLYNCVVKVSNNVQRNVTPSPDQDLNLLIGDEAFGVASFEAMDFNVIRTMPEQLVSAPVRNRGTLGWWFLFGRILFDSNRVVVVGSDATGIG